jgi:SAM-dependent methyltransferase
VERNHGLQRHGKLYLLGHSENEEIRLRKQAEELRPESAWFFDRIVLSSGSRAIDLGCGPQGVLDLLSERVGPSGHVICIERNGASVAIARRFVADRGLKNVDVFQGEASATELPAASFDFVHAPPATRQIIFHTYAIRPFKRGTAFSRFSKDTRLLTGSISLSVAETHRLFREAGLVDIEVKPVIHVYPHGHNRRVVFWDFLQNVRDRVLEQELITESEFDGLTTELKEHLNRPDTLLVLHLFFQVWGRKPIKYGASWLRQIQTKFFHAKNDTKFTAFAL